MSPLGLGLGAIVGLILALTGAGGGILAVPLLVFGLHLTVQQAAPVGLIAVGAAAALGAALGLREGIVRYRAAAMIGVTGMLIAPVGLHLARLIPPGPLLIGFSIVLAWVAARMFRRATWADTSQATRANVPCARSRHSGRLIWTWPCAWAMAATGAVSGMLSGLLGVGGGFVIVPSLDRYTDLGAKSILATSLAVIALVSIGGVSAAAWQGTVEWPVALPFALGAVAALIVGRSIATNIAGARLQQSFAVISGLVSVLLLLRGIGWVS